MNGSAEESLTYDLPRVDNFSNYSINYKLWQIAHLWRPTQRSSLVTFAITSPFNAQLSGSRGGRFPILSSFTFTYLLEYSEDEINCPIH